MSLKNRIDSLLNANLSENALRIALLDILSEGRQEKTLGEIFEMTVKEKKAEIADILPKKILPVWYEHANKNRFNFASQSLDALTGTNFNSEDANIIYHGVLHAMNYIKAERKIDAIKTLREYYSLWRKQTLGLLEAKLIVESLM